MTCAAKQHEGLHHMYARVYTAKQCKALCSTAWKECTTLQGSAAHDSLKCAAMQCKALHVTAALYTAINGPTGQVTRIERLHTQLYCLHPGPKGPGAAIILLWAVNTTIMLLQLLQTASSWAAVGTWFYCCTCYCCCIWPSLLLRSCARAIAQQAHVFVGSAQGPSCYLQACNSYAVGPERHMICSCIMLLLLSKA